MRKIVIMFALVSLAAGCTSTADPTEESTNFTYQHTGDEMWRQLRLEVLEGWRIESADKVSGEITTNWDVRLHSMSNFGRRHRLKITLEGSDDEGYTVVAAQETEKNTNQENPMAEAEADWESMPADGALANRFLFKFHRRMNPPTTWREGR